jgi:serine acetyltransferase
VAAGSTVTRDVPAHALVAGAPARQVGWVGRDGRRLVQVSEGRWVSEATDEAYVEVRGHLTPEATGRP